VLQYSRGVHKIASWAHITNAHPVPGPSVVAGLKSVGLKDGRGLLLLAEMSSKGNLAVGEYRSRAVELARENRAFVVGFIAMKRVEGDSDFLILTPGVGLDESGDGLGQQYRTPDQVVRESGCDVIIVGRGIYGSGSIERMVEEAQRYRLAGWEAYLARIS
jgi:orotidine-5'-phosphate decarboxylase